jgi:glycosyltransferase involved in cell wall biosynthesis
MNRVLLINKEKIPHYRIPVYGRLAERLKENGLELIVVSEGVQDKSPHEVRFRHVESRLAFRKLVGLCHKTRPAAVIFWTNPRVGLFLLAIVLKLMNVRVIHWGHRRDQQSPDAKFRNFVYDLEHVLDDAIILYAPHIKDQMRPRFHRKIFIANNTLGLQGDPSGGQSKDVLKDRFGIRTRKTIVCLGRIQRRKRINDLIEAFRVLDSSDIGLVLAGPDPEGLLADVQEERIYKVGPVYGVASLELLAACDVYCLPGAIGLGIVDAFFCGLPAVTERVPHGPEIMYLKDGINGFFVDRGDIRQLAARLRLLLEDDALRERFAQAARTEIATNGSIDRMCDGFIAALRYVHAGSPEAFS